MKRKQRREGREKLSKARKDTGREEIKEKIHGGRARRAEKGRSKGGRDRSKGRRRRSERRYAGGRQEGVKRKEISEGRKHTRKGMRE